MKRPSLALFLGIIAIILFANPFRVLAQPENLHLTPQQKIQWEEIRAQTKAEIKNILTPEQQKEFPTLISQGQGKLEAIKQLNLSGEQKTQMREISQSSRQGIANILTE